MKRYTAEEMTEVLHLHKLWAMDAEGGQRADLHGADLRGADLQGADLHGAYLQGTYLRGADLQGADLQGADLQGADLRGADLRGAYLQGADLQGADLQGAYLRGADQKMKIAAVAVFTGLYEYQCWAVVLEDGTPWVRMGCLWRSVEEWDRIGIRKSNVGEFPDDGSEKCERRVRAFDFTRAEAIRLSEKAKLGAAS
jgi:hypothetical protein